MTTPTSQSAKPEKPKWGDEEENEDFENELTTEGEPDREGAIHKTIVEYKINDKKQKVKITKRIKVYKTKIKNLQGCGREEEMEKVWRVCQYWFRP